MPMLNLTMNSLTTKLPTIKSNQTMVVINLLKYHQAHLQIKAIIVIEHLIVLVGLFLIESILVAACLFDIHSPILHIASINHGSL